MIGSDDTFELHYKFWVPFNGYTKRLFGINVIDYSSYEIYLHSSPQQSVSLIKKTKLPKKTFPTCYNTIVLALLPLDTPDSLSLVNM